MPATSLPNDTGRHARPRRRRAPLRPPPAPPPALLARIDALEQRLASLEKRADDAHGDRRRLAERVAAEASKPVIRAVDERMRRAERDVSESLRRHVRQAVDQELEQRDVQALKRAIVALQRAIARPSGELAQGLLNSAEFKQLFDERIRGVLDYLKRGADTK